MVNDLLSTPIAPARKFQLVGGDLCLDFCNTVGGHRSGTTCEYLNSYRDLISWAQQAGLLDESQMERLLRQAEQFPAEASSALARALSLREALYRIFLARMKKQAPSADDLELLNGELARTLGRLRVAAQKGHRFEWVWAAPNDALDAPLGPTARSAADLLTSPDRLSKVHQCKGDNCGWLFLDCSKNHSRCWCDMRDCGNRAKVRRHRLKQKRVKPR